MGANESNKKSNDKIVGQKATKKVAERKSANKRINARAIGIWQRRMMGMQVQEIATELGIHEATVWRNLQAVEQSGVIEDRIGLELKKHEELWGLALACVIANIKGGELRAAEDIFKYTGVWTDRLEVTAKIDPNKQQKKMMENMETLLKLSGDKVKGALPEKQAKVDCYGDYAKIPSDSDLTGKEVLPEKMGICHCACVTQEDIEACGCPCHKEKPKETETQFQLEGEALEVAEYEKRERERKEDVKELAKTDPCGPKKPDGCICVGDRHNPLNINPKCPVHGSKGKEQGGGHPPPGGSDV